MWLGLFAVLVAFTYALVKFLTTVHMRRLREVHSGLAATLKRERQRLHSVEGSLQVERSRRGAVEQKLAPARRFKTDLFNRLSVELPPAMAAELRQCVSRHPVPEPASLRTAHELRLADRVTAALQGLCLLLVEFGEDPDGGGSARALLQDDLVTVLTARGIRYAGPEPVQAGEEDGPTRLTTAFDNPEQALRVIRALARAHPGRIATARAVLIAGVKVTGFDPEHVDRSFARALHAARQLLESSPPATLILDARARARIGDRAGLAEHDAAEPLWALSLTATDTDDGEPPEVTHPATVGARPDDLPDTPAAETAAES